MFSHILFLDVRSSVDGECPPPKKQRPNVSEGPAGSLSYPPSLMLAPYHVLHPLCEGICWWQSKERHNHAPLEATSPRCPHTNQCLHGCCGDDHKWWVEHRVGLSDHNLHKHIPSSLCMYTHAHTLDTHMHTHWTHTHAHTLDTHTCTHTGHTHMHTHTYIQI